MNELIAADFNVVSHIKARNAAAHPAGALPSAADSKSVARMVEIDIFKGIAIIAVVVHHCWGLKGWIAASHPWLTSWCVCGFVFCSGLLAAKSPLTTFRQHVTKSAKRLLVPFVVIGTICAVLRQIMEIYLGDRLATPFPPTLAGKLFNHLTLRAVVVNVPLYFLVFLFIVSNLFWFVRQKLARAKLTASYGVAAGVFIIALLLSRLGTPLQLTGFDRDHGALLIFPGAFAYTSGIIAALAQEKQFLAVATHLFAGIGGYCLTSDIGFLSLAVPMVLFTILKQLHRKIEFRWLAFLGLCSGTVFAWHTFLILNSAIRFSASLHLGDAVTILMAATLTIAMCVWLHVIISKLRLNKYLTL